MPIEKQKHSFGEILVADFNKADIMFFCAKDEHSPFNHMLCFAETSETTEAEAENKLAEIAGKILDDVDGVKFIMKFKDPQSITRLISVLSHLQGEVFKYQEWIENPK